jgi:hypothetical protein
MKKWPCPFYSIVKIFVPRFLLTGEFNIKVHHGEPDGTPQEVSGS